MREPMGAEKPNQVQGGSDNSDSKKDADEHGATAVCPGSHAVIMKKNSAGHTEECRKTILDNINMSTQGKKRLKDAEGRRNHFFAKTIENSDRKKRRMTSIDGKSSQCHFHQWHHHRHEHQVQWTPK